MEQEECDAETTLNRHWMIWEQWFCNKDWRWKDYCVEGFGFERIMGGRIAFFVWINRGDGVEIWEK